MSIHKQALSPPKEWVWYTKVMEFAHQYIGVNMIESRSKIQEHYMHNVLLFAYIGSFQTAVQHGNKRMSNTDSFKCTKL